MAWDFMCLVEYYTDQSIDRCKQMPWVDWPLIFQDHPSSLVAHALH